ncbi:MAG: hypothetical protein SCM11_06515, partial [Bacillota bacterium]|nr:hypothetical protein [Bacillota bacterium]
NLDQDQKARIAAIRDGKIASLDSRISNLEIAKRRAQRARSPIGLFGRFLRDSRTVLRRTGGVLGRGIVSAGRTVVHIIRDPRQLIQSAAIMVASGGAANFKDAVLTIIKTGFKSELKKVTYGEIAKMAYENPTLKKAIELKEFLGIKGNDDVELALKEHFNKQAETDEGDGPAGDTDETGDEGDDDYDDPDNEGRQLLEAFAERNRSIKLQGEYTCTTVNIDPITDEHLAVMKEEGMIWSGFTDIAKNISLGPEAIDGELSHYNQYVGIAETISDGRLSLSKSGAEVEATLSFHFIPDLVDNKMERVDKNKYHFIYQKETFITENVSFTIDNLVPGLTHTISRDYEQHEEPWSVTIHVTFELDDEGYLHAKGSFEMDHYTSMVVSQYAYYYGYFTSEYSFHFVSEKALE